MRTIFTFLNHLRGSMGNLQSSDVSLDRRLTVGSPSGLDAKWKQNPFMRFAVVLTLIFTIGSGNAWGALPANPTWTATALADIADDATVIIISSSGHALPSTTTNSSPAKISCTVTTSAGVSTISPASGTLQNLAWTVDKLASSWKFYQEGSNTIHLYLSGTGSNTALRVGSGSSNDQFVMGNGGKLLKVTTATRYVGPYSSGSDWRTYNSETHANYGSASLTFYVLNTGGGCTTPPSVGASLTSVSSTINSITATAPISAIGGCNITENGLVYSTSVATPTVGAANCTKVTTTACGSTAANKTVTISDLPCGTSYYVRGYATNAAGTSYTNVTTQSTSACPLYTVTLMDDSDTRTQASYGAAVTLPSRAGCSGYTFAGWSTTYNANWTTTVPTIISAGSYTPTDNINLYPVYTKTEGGSEEDHDGPSFSRSSSKNTITTGYTLTTNASAAAAYYADQTPNGTNIYVGIYNSSTPIFSSTPSSITITATIGGGSGNKDLGEPILAQLLDNTGSPIGTAATITTHVTNSGGDTYSDISIPTTGITSAYGVRISHIKESGWNARYYSFSLSYTTGGSTTYYISVPNCCTALGSINGSVSLSQLATPDPTKLKASWTMNAETGIASYTLKVYDSSDNLVKTINNYTSGSEITGLTPCTEYYVKLYTVSSGSPYCEGGLIGTSSSCTTNSYNVTFPTLTGTTKLTGNATACASDDYVATFEAANAAYELPTASGVTVTIGGSPATSGTDYTWAVSEEVGTLTISTAKQTGDITIAVVSVAHSCSATPTLGAASLSGAFSLSSVGISCAGITPGSYCAVESGDYGFIWYEGTASDKKIGDTGVTKVAISTGDYSSGSFSTALSSTFVAGNTYTFRAFATNTGDNTGYSAESSFTPRSVTFDSNGGSAVATVYVNSGSAVSEPSAPTRTGYDFVKWQLSGADYIFSSAVNANITLVAVWGAKSYTVTLDQQSGSGGTGSVSATYDADMPSATMPTRSGYDFGGYYGSEGGAGTQYYAADGSSAHTWDVADAKTLYAKWTAKNYTITLNNEGADSGKEGTESLSVTFDANTNLTSVITKPVKDGYKFGGYFTSTDGSGTQIIDKNGNVKASVTSYTSATKQWIYANDIELHAYWKPSYTVTWSVNGETTTEQVVSGEQVAALPTDPTSSDCDDAKVFVGWRSTAIDGVSVSAPSGIFTTQAASPAITGNTTFYAVFADDNEETKHLTNSELETFYGTTTNRSYANGPFTITSSDGDWYGVCAAAYSTPSYYYVNIKSDNVTISAVSTRPYLRSPIYSSDINRITITHNSSTDRTLLICSSASADPATDKIATISITNSNKSGVYADISSGVSQLYLYSSSGAIPIMSIDVNIGTPSNYVTSCSSCDADATFTNTTPAVSAIDCDAATLTATGGLATLGADGCNVSDYGFVIGTTDNPAIGGSGVTKLQVGTTNPTIGADFSNDAEGLTKGTHYYIRAYATNRHGTAYSGSQNFWTKGVSSIAITTAPTKTKYVEGETFDKTGMVVTATMAGGSTEDVTSDCTFSPSLSTKLSDETTVRATYSLCDVNKTADQAINVYTLTVTEGTNDTYGTAGKTDNKVTVTGLGDHKTYTVTVTSGNADKIDNGDGTYTITNATGNVTVRVDYADAVQVKVYYKVDGVTVTGLTQDVYQSETTTLPTASELATEMTAQGMEIPDDSYPNFVGWSETEFGAQTSEPTLVTGTPTINAEKTYYAVYTNLNVIRLDKTSTGVSTSNPAEGSADVSITVGGKGFKRNYLIYQNEAGGVNPYLQFKKNATYYGRIYNSDALTNILKVVVAYKNADSNVKVYACSAAGTISGDAITAGTRGATDPYVYTMPANTQYLMVRGDAGTTYKTYYIDIYYSPATVEYMTQFCTNRVTLTQNSPEHGTVEFGRSSLVTCGSDKNVSLTIIPDVGYQLTGWTVNTSSGYADAKTTSPAVVTNSNNSAAQNITLTFAEDANKDYDVTAIFGLMTVTSWTWTYNSAAMPNPLNLYVGQRARMDVAYTPAGVDASKKTYTREKNNTYINWVGDKQAAYSTIEGRASTGENTTPVTFTHGDGPTTTVNVKVLPLPAVHFEDIVHNVEFADVVATLSDNALSPTKTTPTHADFDGSTANTCEEQHLHLVGWIREDWPALVTYLNGGAQPSTSDITSAGNDGSGNAYFFEPGASINTQTFNGVTFYAVWAKVE